MAKRFVNEHFKLSNMENQLFKKAIKTFGELSQYDMLIEEMAELTQAILKNRRRNGTKGTVTENLHEEFVDVSIVMRQIELLLDPKRLQFWYDTKIERLAERVESHA